MVRGLEAPGGGRQELSSRQPLLQLQALRLPLKQHLAGQTHLIAGVTLWPGGSSGRLQERGQSVSRGVGC